MRLIDKHFKQDDILHKIFNRKTLKISYSCTKNISQIINSHDNEIINEFHNQVNNNINSKKIECNCKSRSDCPMNGLCNLDNVVYQTIIYPKEDINDRKSYIGISLGMEIINFLSPMSIKKIKLLYLNTIGD